MNLENMLSERAVTKCMYVIPFVGNVQNSKSIETEADLLVPQAAVLGKKWE